MRMTRILAVPFLVLSGACTVFGPKDHVCTADPKYALKVQIKDSASGAWTASSAYVVARDGSFVDSVQVGAAPFLDGTQVLLGSNRSGQYQLTVRKPTYRDWIRTGIQAASDGCGVVATDIMVLLQPATP